MLNPPLFAIVIDAVMREARAGLPWVVLYADDLVLMAPSREELHMKLEEYQRCLVDKGLKMNPQSRRCWSAVMPVWCMAMWSVECMAKGASRQLVKV